MVSCSRLKTALSVCVSASVCVNASVSVCVHVCMCVWLRGTLSVHRDRSSRVRSALSGRSCDTHVSAGLSAGCRSCDTHSHHSLTHF